MGCGGGLPAIGSSVHELGAQYQFLCAQCHGAAGTSRSATGMELPGRVLADRKWLGKQDVAALVRSIMEGKDAMPSFKYKLTPEEARRLLLEVVRPMARRSR